MTHRYDRGNNDKKRGSRWLLFHCAVCGDLLPKYCVELHQRVRRPEICDCSAQLQSMRRSVREDAAARLAKEIERERRAPRVRPDYSDPVTKLGA